MPVLSLFVIFFIAKIFFMNISYEKRFYILFLALVVSMIYHFQGYFIKIGNSEISTIGAVLQHILFIYSCYGLICRKIFLSKKIFFAGLAFYWISIICCVSEVVFPYSGLLLPQNDVDNWDNYIIGYSAMIHYKPSIITLLREEILVLESITVICIFKEILNLDMLKMLYIDILKWIKPGVYYGVFEFVLKNVIGNLTITYDLSALLLGVNSFAIHTEAIKKGYFYALQGLTREPSYFANFVFWVFVICLIGRLFFLKIDDSLISKIHLNRLLIISGIELFVVGGFSSVWLIFILFILFIRLFVANIQIDIRAICKKYKLHILFFLLLLCMVLGIILSNDYFYNRLSDAFLVIDFISDSSSLMGVAAFIPWGDQINSTIARMVSIVEGVNIFKGVPFWGLGPNIQTVHSSTITTLLSFGIVGTAFLCKFMIASKDGKKYDSMLIIILYFLAGLPISINSSISYTLIILLEVSFYYVNRGNVTNA